MRKKLRRLREWWSWYWIPTDQRCMQCFRRRASWEETNIRTGEIVYRRCHHCPPPEFAESAAARCQQCGRTFWPDILHLDCLTVEPTE